MTAIVPCPFCATLNRIDLDRVGHGPRCGECGRPILVDRPIKVDGEAFDRVVRESEAPLLVDFYADWCGPCRMMAPALDAFAAARAGEVLVLKLDTDRSPAVSQRFGVRGIPTLIAFRGGQETGRHVGMAGPEILEGLVRE